MGPIEILCITFQFMARTKLKRNAKVQSLQVEGIFLKIYTFKIVLTVALIIIHRIKKGATEHYMCV